MTIPELHTLRVELQNLIQTQYLQGVFDKIRQYDFFEGYLPFKNAFIKDEFGNSFDRFCQRLGVFLDTCIENEITRLQTIEKNRYDAAHQALLEKQAEIARLEQERQAKEQELAQIELKRTMQEKRDKERAAARLERERQEKERQRAEAARLERERQEKERQRAEAARLERERQEKERQRAEAARLEQERQEKERPYNHTTQFDWSAGEPRPKTPIPPQKNNAGIYIGIIFVLVIAAIVWNNLPMRNTSYESNNQEEKKEGAEKEVTAEEAKAIEAIKYYDQAMDEKNSEAKIKLYDKAIELNPDYAHAYNNRGIAKKNLGKYQEAIIDYDKSIELNNPELHLPYNNRGWAKYNLGKYQEAIIDYDKAIELKPDYATAYWCRALAYTKLKKKEETLQSLRKAIRLDKQYKESARIASEFFWLRGDSEFEALLR